MSALDLSQLDDVLAMLTGDTSHQSNTPTPSVVAPPTTSSSSSTVSDESREPRPTMSSFDAFYSNLTSAFDSLDGGTGDKNANVDDLSSTIFNLNSVIPKEREQALLKLVNLSVEENKRGDILKRDGVRTIVTLLSLENGLTVCRLASQAIANLALHEGCRNEVTKVGGIPKLFGLLKETSDDELILRSLSAVSNLCNNNQVNRTKFGELGLLDVISNILSVKASSSPLVGRALTAIINFIFDEENQRKVVNSRLLNVINSFFSSHEEEQKTQAVWIFAVLSTGPGDVQEKIARSGGLAALVKLIPSSKSSDQLDKILTALVNISNNEDILESIMEADGIKHLVNLIKDTKLSTSSRILAAQSLNNLAFNDKCTLKIGEEGGAKAVVEMLKWTFESKERSLEDIGLRMIVNLAFSPIVRKQLNESNVQALITASSSSSENAPLALQNLRVPC